MNRRQFTASLGAAAALPFVPLPTAAASTAATNLPPAAYAWAHLYARAQPTMSAAKLARYLRIDTGTANQLMSKLVADGVVSTPSTLGAARALRPIPKPTQSTTLLQQAQNAAKSLVKDQSMPLDAPDDDTPHQETANASPDKHLQEVPERG